MSATTTNSARIPVLLIRPPDPLQSAQLLSHTRPMNLAYLAAYLRREGIPVRIIDYEVEPFREKDLARTLQDLSPSVVAVSCMTPTIETGAALCAMAKRHAPSITTVVGGPHASGLPEETLREYPSFDYVVFGEGERTFHELVQNILNRNAAADLPGLVWRNHGVPTINPPAALIQDLDSLPFPARDLIPSGKQTGHSTRGFSNTLRSTELYTSRGCPFGCSFCAIQATFGRSVRFRDPENIAVEVGLIARDHRINHLVIADDTFTLDPERAIRICDVLRSNGIRSWNCDTRVTSASRPLFQAMRKSGCQKVAFGVESGSQRILDRIGKKIRMDQVEEAVRWAKEAGIRFIEGNFIIGSDVSETEEDIELTRKAIMRLPWTFVSISVIVPYPGTPVYRTMRARGLIEKDVCWNDFAMFGASPKWRTDNFTAADLVRIQRSLTRQFYLDPLYILGRLAALRSWEDVRYWFTAGTSFLRWYLTGKVK